MSASRTTAGARRAPEKRIHAVTIDHCNQLGFERVEDAMALIKLLEKSRLFDYRANQYGKAPAVEYRVGFITPGEPA